MKNALKQITRISTASFINLAFIIVSVNSGLTQTANTDNTDIQVIREYKKILMRQTPKIRNKLWISPQGEDTIPTGAKAMCGRAQILGSWSAFHKNFREEINSLNYSDEVKELSITWSNIFATLGRKFYCPNIPMQSAQSSNKKASSTPTPTLLPRTANKPIQSTQSSKKNGGNQRYIQLAYCSSSSGQGDWINWGEQTPDRACQLVRNKFASWGQTISRSEFGYYKSNGENTVQVSCSRGFKFTQTGFNYEVFNKSVEIVRKQGVEGTCVYKVIN